MEAINDVFSRQQALVLSGLSSGQLSRLDTAGIVCPKKLGSSTHPTVLYTANQIIELKAIAHYRRHLTNQELISVLENIRAQNFDLTLFQRFLVISCDWIYWVYANELGDKVAQLCADNNGCAVVKVIHPIESINAKTAIVPRRL